MAGLTRRGACGGLAGLVIVALFAAGALAQAQKPPPPQTTVAPPAASGRTEILNYDNWTVTCRDGRDAREKRLCSAELTIFQEANGQRRAVFIWVIGHNRDGALATAMRFLTGVTIAPGLELKLADKPSRKLPITTCEPAYCEASMPLDDALLRDAQAIQQAEAVVTASDGRQVVFTINMKGFAQAVAAVRR